MIASSLREGDELVDLLLRKEADVNLKSTSRVSSLLRRRRMLIDLDYNGQVLIA